MLLLGTQVHMPDGGRAFAFKLHQFISQGGAVYATLEAPETRLLTLEGQYYTPGGGDKLLFPLRFCRVCGQEYYQVFRQEQDNCVLPMADESADLYEESPGKGYLLLDPNGRWEDDPSALPEHWFEPSRPNRLKKDYERHRPTLLYVRPNGKLADGPAADAVPCWYQISPFMLCLSCGEAYTRRDEKDFRKLSALSSEGRSTATTLLSLSTVAAMRNTDLPREAQKILSFTDNRQDASLQAGHFNDFVQVAMLRSALYAALKKHGELRFDTVAGRVVEALGLDLADYARPAEGSEGEPLNPLSPQAEKTRAAFCELIEYRLYEDLRRGWRVVQPNLEQCGLLRIEYEGLVELAGRDSAWQGVTYMATLDAERRAALLRTLLDEMRRQSTIDVACLKRGTVQDELKRRAREYLGEQWAFGDEERLRYASFFVLPGDDRNRGDFSLSDRSVIGRWLKGLMKEALGRPVTGVLGGIRRADSVHHERPGGGPGAGARGGRLRPDTTGRLAVAGQCAGLAAGRWHTRRKPTASPPRARGRVFAGRRGTEFLLSELLSHRWSAARGYGGRRTHRADPAGGARAARGRVPQRPVSIAVLFADDGTWR